MTTKQDLIPALNSLGINAEDIEDWDSFIYRFKGLVKLHVSQDNQDHPITQYPKWPNMNNALRDIRALIGANREKRKGYPVSTGTTCAFLNPTPYEITHPENPEKIIATYRSYVWWYNGVYQPGRWTPDDVHSEVPDTEKDFCRIRKLKYVSCEDNGTYLRNMMHKHNAVRVASAIEVDPKSIVPLKACPITEGGIPMELMWPAAGLVKDVPIEIKYWKNKAISIVSDYVKITFWKGKNNGSRKEEEEYK